MPPYNPFAALATPTPPKQKKGAFWTALDILNRPHSAISGVLSAVLSGKGDDALVRAREGLLGESQYGGADIARAVGVDPESTTGRVGGLLFDFLNPADPLNYVGGLGVLTEAGKAKRLLEGAESVADWRKAAQAGDRALLSFAGQPIIGGAPVLGKMQEAGSKLRDSAVGREFTRLFGGKYGSLLADPSLGKTKEARDLIEMQMKTDQDMLGMKRAVFDPIMEGKALAPGSEEGRRLGELMDLVDRGDEGAQDALQAYLDANPKAKAFYEAQAQWKAKAAELLQELDGTGLARFGLDADPNFLPRIPYENVARATEKAGTSLDLQGPAANILNRRLAPGSSLGVDPQTFTRVGQIEWQQIGEQGFLALPDKAKADFLKRNRRTSLELHRDPELSSKYVIDAQKRADYYIDQVLKNLHSDRLVRNYVDAGLASKWDDAVHGKGGFIKIDQGRWANEPLALPKKVDEALEVLTKNSMPERAGLFGAWANEVLSWWKAGALFTQPSYFARNMVTGVLHNAVEGMDLAHPRTFRLYKDAEKMLGADFLFKRGAPKTDGVITLKPWVARQIDDGTWIAQEQAFDIPKQRLWDEYFNRGLDGGGGFIGSTAKEGALTRTGEFRERVFRPALSFNQRVEVGIRMPLMLKTIEDTLTAAGRAGMQIDDKILNRAFDNAAEAVRRAHFDYTDLSPFEQRLKQLIPFYTWSRKNLPYEVANMMQKPGKYAGYIRAYYNAWIQSGLDHDDAPPWIAEGYSLPWGESDSGDNLFMDLSNFLPSMDVVRLALAVTPNSQPGGKDWTERAAGYGLQQINPFISEIFEQGMSKDIYTGREFGSTTPQEMLGIPMQSRLQHAITNLAPPVGVLDRLNPFDVWTKVGNKTGAVQGDERRFRNEPGQAERLSRFLFGPKIYEAEDDLASMSAKRRKREYKVNMGKARRAKTKAERAFYTKLAEQYME